jgi:membrane protease subunit (stomatin/prohibitin family)
MTKVKSYIARVIRQEEISIFEIDEHLEEISESLRKALYEDFLDYGVALERFFITTVLKPDGEASYEKFKDLHFRQYSEVAEAKLRQQVGVIDAHTSAQKTIIESQAIATKRAQEGYTYQDERSFDVAEIVAANDAPMPFGSVNIGNIAATAPAPATSEKESKCHACGKLLPPDTKFCPECGEKVLPKIPEGMVICPECKKVVAKSKFCPECGHKMVTVCRECGKEIGDAKFCPECGAKQ